MCAGKFRRMKRLADIDWVATAVEMCGKLKGAAVASDLDVPSFL